MNNQLTRRDFLQTVGACAGAMALPELLPAATELPKPNIVFLFSDQQRWDTVECYGSPLFKGLTPNLDRMAQEGVRFQHSFTCQPVCGPARACLQTGKYATETTCVTNGVALPATEKTLAHMLSQGGYEVGYVGKWHLASAKHQYADLPVPPELRGGYKDFWLASDVLEFTSHGYDGFMFDQDGKKREFPPGRYRADAQTDWVLEYLRTRAAGAATSSPARPFFLFVSYIEPHHQNDHKHFEGPKGSKERFKDFNVPGDLKDAAGDWKAEMPDYLGCCNNLDENVGRIRGELSRLGLADNTVVFYTSDHACHFRTRNSEYKRSCHENAIRTPLIAVGPGFRGGKVVSELVSLIDLPPTVLQAGGVTPPASMRGRPLQELAAGTARDWPQDVFIQISESHTGRAVRTAKWKYSVRKVGETYVEDFLYDLQADPSELKNLVADASLANVREELAGRIKAYMEKIGDPVLPIRPAGQGKKAT